MGSLEEVMAALSRSGVRQVLVKHLAPNDNSKNQVYLGGSLGVLNFLPMGPVASVSTPKGEHILKAGIEFSWLRGDGSLARAPNTQLIMYPQYPEVRLSGFLKASEDAPSALMTSRDPGRTLFLGVTPDRSVVGYVTNDPRIALEAGGFGELNSTGMFRIGAVGGPADPRGHLLSRLARIARAGWLPARRLDRDGTEVVCRGTNCGGYTLEAQLGIRPNGRAEPDFDGWEVKGHRVSTLAKFGVGPLTLMTPEPTGGFYKDGGPVAFVRRYGYPDQAGIPNRINFSSPHRIGHTNALTGLTLTLTGYDRESGRIADPHGGFALIDRDGSSAAVWHFASLLTHWNRKHAQAAYVPYVSRADPEREYRYAPTVHLGEGTDFSKFLEALAANQIWYDPGIKLEEAESRAPRLKRRSQFRIRSSDLTSLYAKFENVTLPPN